MSISRLKALVMQCALTLGLVLGLLGAAAQDDAPGAGGSGVDPFYVARERIVSGEKLDRLTAERSEIRRRHLSFTVGYTTAMDRQLERIAGRGRRGTSLRRHAPKPRHLMERRTIDLTRAGLPG